MMAKGIQAGTIAESASLCAYICSHRVDQRAERIKAIARQPWVLSGPLIDLILNREGLLLVVRQGPAIPNHCGKMAVFRVVLHLGTLIAADSQHFFQLFGFGHHSLAAFPDSGFFFANMGENWTGTKPLASQ